MKPNDLDEAHVCFLKNLSGRMSLLGMDLKELSIRSQIPYPTLQKLAKGNHEPSMKQLTKLSNALDWRVSDFFQSSQAVQMSVRECFSVLAKECGFSLQLKHEPHETRSGDELTESDIQIIDEINKLFKTPLSSLSKREALILQKLHTSRIMARLVNNASVSGRKRA